MSTDLPITDRLIVPSADLAWQFSRAGGPGGQHVNTTESRAQLRFALEECQVLSAPVKARLRQANPQWCTDDGDMVIASGGERSRLRNIEEVRRRLKVAIREALTPPKRRRATRPSRRSKERRLESKKQRGQVKAGRGRYKGE
ncbi:MAG: ribosome-associated protein [Myxococcota bacterium]|jgi:ribosome-associated protein